MSVTPAPQVELHVVEAVPTPAEVYQRYSRYVASLAFHLMGRDADVNDVVQDVFVAAIEGMDRIRAPAALKGWLATLTVRMARRRLQRRRLVSLFGFDEGPPFEPASTAASPEQRALLAQVYAALDGVSANERVAWVLRYVEGEPLEMVAQHCGCSLATAKRRIAAAHAFMERSFADAA
ncbi:MAG: sigma-70 family RNA polymerase sigma factor [Archangium sp.]|nr:sigma-70 family RNA polymerase sigma factor [Archangium sp.]